MRLIDADELIALCNMVADEADGMGKSIWEQFATTVEWSPTVEAVPVKWIEDYLEQIHEDLDYARQDNDEEAMKRIFWKYETIRWMVADWRHDEKTR